MTNFFTNIEGNDQVKEYLKKMVDNNAVGNSLLFAGPANANKELFAMALARQLLGPAAQFKIDAMAHPDLHVYKPEGKIGMHSISSMRKFCDDVYLPPFESKWKIFIIHDAERMLSYSANALLKTFEEPSLDSVIILLSSNPTSLLPTVLSRCRTISFRPLLKEKKADSEMRRKVLDILSVGQFSTYNELSSAAVELSDFIDAAKQTQIDQYVEEAKDISQEMLSASQKQALEKELEGLATMKQSQEIKHLFDIILSWYRDLELLNVNADKSLLENSDYEEILTAKLKIKKNLNLDKVQKMIKEAIVSVERSTSLNLVFEKLFLELQFI